jgi:hypothetical protein
MLQPGNEPSSLYLQTGTLTHGYAHQTMYLNAQSKNGCENTLIVIATKHRK